MATNQQLLAVVVAILAAAVVSFALTPLVKRFAVRFGFVDVPKDGHRMHNRPNPTIGGLAIYAAFVLVVLVMSNISRQMLGILCGGTIILIMGVLDDKYDLNAHLKIIVQFAAALIPVIQGTVISYVTNPLPVGNPYIPLGALSIPITVIWIVAITNAVNFIDGLDGLSVGVCSISCLSMSVIARIFMGDTGATFLGFILACMSVSGLFKLYTMISFAIPILVLGVPIFDITFATLRRIHHHVSPMHSDRSHIHHRLIDVGFNQRQSVAILYVVASLLGVFAVMLSTSGSGKALMVLAAAVAVGIIALVLLSQKTPPDENSASEAEDPNTPHEDGR